DSGDFVPVQEGDFSVVSSFVHRKMSKEISMKKSSRMSVIHPHAAGVDIGAEFPPVWAGMHRAM
ncbi:hypothetical protein AUA58_20935, partial [Salmonella enterica subsp. arizonae serovar 18:z4,z23:-]|nr:hypothetical protein [Salmonella enterica subsp. arizonae serovar 18:z4,z23:-]ECU7244052.1 hypothetical protein [Salmonella enterica subsp. arizonae serovar 18:z4,z23:-]